MTDAMPRTLVIGLGNPLMGDDGIGLVALAELRDAWDVSPDVLLVDGGTWGMNLLPMIEDAESVLLLDAIHAGGLPGTVTELVGDAVPRRLQHKLSPHQIDLQEVLALAALRGTVPLHLAAIGIEPDRVEMTTELSAAARAAMPLMLECAAGWLEALGHRCIPTTRQCTN